ncbi:MarR family transcriptional regulator [Oleiagrimonas soli]|nr:MarR family transcriptional regulator [Oleiagrimonas soli]MBB6183438.1 MarR family transcriptional repressor of emrRAB [Oleiagrimonas soli]
MKAAVCRVAERVPDLPIDDIVLLRMLHIVNAGLDQSEERWLKPYQLGNSEFRTLMMLFSSPEQQAHPSDLCQWASQKPTNMTRIVDTLLERGLVTRRSSDADRRRIILQVTPEGSQLVRTLLPKLQPNLKALFSAFTRSESRQMTVLLEKLLRNLDAMDTVQE